MTDIKLPKVLGLRDLILFTVSAIVLLDTLAASASIGASSLFWWLFLGVTFLLPIGFITAELGTSYPAEGGLYVWIRRAFGERWAARAVWAYWVNMAIWLPAIYVLFTTVLSQLFNIPMPLPLQIGLGIGLAWTTAFLDVIGLRVAKWIPNIGATFKLLIFSALIFAGYRYSGAHGFATDINFASIAPHWQDGIQYLPVIIYGMLGFELVSAAGGEIRHPGRDVPKAVFASALIVLTLYFFSTVGILIAIPSDQIDIVEGLVHTLNLLFADIPGGSTIVMILGVGALFSFFSNGATWAMGCNRTTAEAAAEGQLPRVFAYRHPRHGGPVGTAIMMGGVCTIALLAYGAIAASNEDLFWSLFAFSAVIFMMPYVGMSLSFLKLRIDDPDHPRPYRAPGGIKGAWFLTIITSVILILTLGLLIYVPGDGLQKETFFGMLVVLGIGEILIRISEVSQKRGASRKHGDAGESP